MLPSMRASDADQTTERERALAATRIFEREKRAIAALVESYIYQFARVISLGRRAARKTALAAIAAQGDRGAYEEQASSLFENETPWSASRHASFRTRTARKGKPRDGVRSEREIIRAG